MGGDGHLTGKASSKARRGFWRRNRRLWTCYPRDWSIEASLGLCSQLISQVGGAAETRTVQAGGLGAFRACAADVGSAFPRSTHALCGRSIPCWTTSLRDSLRVWPKRCQGFSPSSSCNSSRQTIQERQLKFRRKSGTLSSCRLRAGGGLVTRSIDFVATAPSDGKRRCDRWEWGHLRSLLCQPTWRWHCGSCACSEMFLPTGGPD